MKITQEVTAWLTGHTSAHIAIAADLANLQLGQAGISFSNYDMAPDWIRIGVATITLEAVPPEALTAAAVEALREQITTIRAIAQAKATELEGEINNLLALPMTVEAEQ